MNIFDILFMRKSGRIKPDSSVFDILFWENTSDGKKRVLFPSTTLHPANSIYPTALDIESNDNQ